MEAHCAGERWGMGVSEWHHGLLSLGESGLDLVGEGKSLKPERSTLSCLWELPERLDGAR